MKHIKPYRIFESQEHPQHIEHPGFPKTEEEIHKICELYDIYNYSINDDLSIDVNGDVNLVYLNLDFLPLNFNYISGDFNCFNNELTTLKGSPKEVGGYFNCNSNRLTSLEGGPQKIGDYFTCYNNELTSLEGSPKKISSYFNCSLNKLKLLKGASEKVGKSFDCSNNNLKSLNYSPKEVGGDFDCYDNKLMSLYYLPKGINYTNISSYFTYNPIYKLVNTFIDKDNAEELITEFNDYDIVRENTVVLNRLKVFCSDFDLEMPVLDEVKEYYKIV